MTEQHGQEAEGYDFQAIQDRWLPVWEQLKPFEIGDRDGADVATATRPQVPPAPALLSMTLGWPRSFESSGAMTRPLSPTTASPCGFR